MIATLEGCLRVDSGRIRTSRSKRHTSYMDEYMIFEFNCSRPNGGLNDLVDIVDCRQSLINVLAKEIGNSGWNNNSIQVFDKLNNEKVLEIILHYDLTITIVNDELDIVTQLL